MSDDKKLGQSEWTWINKIPSNQNEKTLQQEALPVWWIRIRMDLYHFARYRSLWPIHHKILKNFGKFLPETVLRFWIRMFWA